MGSLFILSNNLGVLIAFTFGHFLSYIISPTLLLGVPIIFMLTFIFFPETPQFLMRNGRDVVGI